VIRRPPRSAQAVARRDMPDADLGVGNPSLWLDEPVFLEGSELPATGEAS